MTQVGVPISVPKRAAALDDVRRLIRLAREARENDYPQRAASLLDTARWHRLAISEEPVMCVIGDGRIVRGPMGQRPPQAWRDLYTIERGPPSPVAALEALQHG